MYWTTDQKLACRASIHVDNDGPVAGDMLPTLITATAGPMTGMPSIYSGLDVIQNLYHDLF